MRSKTLAVLLFAVIGCQAISMAHDVQELMIGSPVRQKLFNLLRPTVESRVELKVTFYGTMLTDGEWTFFNGVAKSPDGRNVVFASPDHENLFALWRLTDGGWKLVDVAMGRSEGFFGAWRGRYGVPSRVLGLDL